MRLAYSATEGVQAAIGRIGRTEEVVFSPGNGTLALVGIFEQRLLFLRVELGEGAERLAPAVRLLSPPARRVCSGFPW